MLLTEPAFISTWWSDAISVRPNIS